MFVYYNIYKRYKGIFKKKNVGNVHTLIVPRNSKDFIYLLIIGEIIGEKNTYITERIFGGEQSIIPYLNKLESEKHMVPVAKVSCTVVQKENGFAIKLNSPTPYLPPVFTIEEPGEEYSSISNDKTLILKGKLKLVSEGITQNQYRMVKAKKMAFFKRIKDSIIKKFRGK